MPEEAATPAAGSAGATTTSGEKNKTENALTANKAARAGGPASTSYKVIDETSVTVPSKLPAVNRDAMSRPTGAEVAEAARRLDIDLVFDADLLYIAEELLMSPVPEGWEMHEDDQGRKYYASKTTLKTQWQHPMEEYYKGVVFMRKEGEQLLEEKASRSPPTPEETREMARYFDTKTELDLLEIAKAAVNAPLPPEWEEYEDDSGEVLFYNAITKKTSEHHPLDAYFLELVRQRRGVRAAEAAADGGKSFAETASEATKYGVSDFWQLNEQFVPYPWMEFVHPKNGQLYFYNFKENVASYCHPVHLIRDELKIIAVVYIQKLLRGWKVRKDAVSIEEHAAASKIQSGFRGKKARDTYRQAQHDRIVKTATRIQRAWRAKLAADEEKALALDTAARLIQRQCRIRLARMRRSSQEKFGPRALPPHVDAVFPSVSLLKERATALLASPAPFAAALAALDAFVVPPEAGTEVRLKAAATSEGGVVAGSNAEVAGADPVEEEGGGGGGGGASAADGAVVLQDGGAGGVTPSTPLAPLASDLDGIGGGGGDGTDGGEDTAVGDSDTVSMASSAVLKKKKAGGKGGRPKKKK